MLAKITGSMFFEGMNSDTYVRLILTPLFEGLKRRNKSSLIHTLYKNRKTIFDDILPVFEEKCSVVCREIFPEVATPA